MGWFRFYEGDIAPSCSTFDLTPCFSDWRVNRTRPRLTLNPEFVSKYQFYRILVKRATGRVPAFWPVDRKSD